MTSDRRGFTLVELIVVTVLGAVLVAAALQILITNQRAYTTQTAEIQGQQTTRAAADVLFNELREISAQGGDLITMGQHSMVIRTMRRFGVACLVASASPPVVRVLKVGDWFEVDDSVFVFADVNANVSSDDTWITAKVSARDTTVSCGSSKGENLSLSGHGSSLTTDSVHVGAAVRSFVRYEYGLVTVDGQTYLGRTNSDKEAVPLVGPVQPTSGVEFTYLDAAGAVTSTAADVRQIRVTVRTLSQVMNSAGNLVADSLTAVIYTRN